jgi:HK97 family phage major capsid protein
MKKIQTYLVPVAGFLCLILMAGMLSPLMHHPAGLALAIGAAATTRPLTAILAEMKKIQEDYTGKAMPPAEGEKFDALALEYKAIESEAKRGEIIEQAERFGREVVDPILPPDSEGKGANGGSDAIVGYLTPGSAFVNSPEFKQYLADGMPEQRGSGAFRVKGLHGGQRFIPVTRAELKAMGLEGKAIATVGASVIRTDRIAEVVRSAEMRIDFLRDLLNQSRTGSSAVEYVTTTPAAAASLPVAENVAKPETSTTLGTATAPVRTIAVWMPVTEQQLQDVPQVEDLINNELTYDLKLTEDAQIAWGAGTGQNLLGIFNTSGVNAQRTVGGDTLLDKVRRAVTDVRVANGMATGIGIHPYDWEALQLLKGTDSRYIWVVVPDRAGDRLWGLPVAETVAMQEPGAYTTNERRILVGDFQRGATLWDRQEANVAVGYVNTDFIQNRRTIRAEERLAFGVKRPALFRYVIAQARVP